jgi:hypothetical protein
LRSIRWRRALGTSFALFTSRWRFSLGLGSHGRRSIQPNASARRPLLVHSPSSTRSHLRLHRGTPWLGQPLTVWVTVPLIGWPARLRRTPPLITAAESRPIQTPRSRAVRFGGEPAARYTEHSEQFCATPPRFLPPSPVSRIAAKAWRPCVVLRGRDDEDDRNLPQELPAGCHRAALRRICGRDHSGCRRQAGPDKALPGAS